MKDFNALLAYIATEVLAIIIGIPAIIVGYTDALMIATLLALLSTLIYIEFTKAKEIEDIEE